MAGDDGAPLVATATRGCACGEAHDGGDMAVVLPGHGAVSGAAGRDNSLVFIQPSVWVLLITSSKLRRGC
jgi:hypothetical protein